MGGGRWNERLPIDQAAREWRSDVVKEWRDMLRIEQDAFSIYLPVIDDAPSQ